MASERLRQWAERVRGGESGPVAAAAVGYAESTAKTRTHVLRAQALAEGLLPDPDLDRRVVAAHEEAVDAFMDRLRAELPAAADLLIAAMKGEVKATGEDGEAGALPSGQWRALLEFMNRVVGRPAIHIHGHKDQAELDAEREKTIYIVNEARK